MIDSVRNRPLPWLVAGLGLVAIVVVLAVLLSGGKDARETLDQAFRKPISSADVALDLTAQVQGVPQLRQPIRLQVRGPYHSNGPRKLPRLDLDASFSLLGRTIPAGFVSTGDNVYVRFQGEAYEAGPGLVRQVNEQLARQAGQQPERTSLQELGIDPRRWLRDPEDRGEAQIAGVETTHISASVDVSRLLEDLNRLAERTASAAGAGGGRATQLTPEQRRQVEQVVQDPRLDVYVGKDDGILRRISADLRLEVPEAQRQQAGGATGGSISFSIEFANVGSARPVTAPQNARPLSELQGQLAALLAGGAPPQGDAAPPPAGGSAQPAPGDDAEERLRRVRECLNEAGEDQAAQQRCAELL